MRDFFKIRALVYRRLRAQSTLDSLDLKGDQKMLIILLAPDNQQLVTIIHPRDFFY